MKGLRCSECFVSRRVVSLAVAACATLSAAGCKKEAKSQESAIIGKDDRATAQREVAIGKLSLYGDAVPFCTAFATGSQEVTTSSHCLSEEFHSEAYAFVDGMGRVHPVESILESNPKSSIARLRIRGEQPNWFVWAPAAAGEAVIRSYDWENGRYVEAVGRLEKSDSAGLWKHDIDSVPGASGSPIVQGGKVVAVHLGSQREGNSLLNIAVGFPFDPATDIATVKGKFSPENIAGIDGAKIVTDAVREGFVGVCTPTVELLGQEMRNVRNRGKPQFTITQAQRGLLAPFYDASLFSGTTVTYDATMVDEVKTPAFGVDIPVINKHIGVPSLTIKFNHVQGVTFGDEIYVKARYVDGSDSYAFREQVFIIGHELFHTLQARSSGGVHGFARTYCQAIWYAGGDYSRIRLEIDAFSKENTIRNSLK